MNKELQEISRPLVSELDWEELDSELYSELSNKLNIELSNEL